MSALILWLFVDPKGRGFESQMVDVYQGYNTDTFKPIVGRNVRSEFLNGFTNSLNLSVFHLVIDTSF